MLIIRRQSAGRRSADRTAARVCALVEKVISQTEERVRQGNTHVVGKF